MAKDYWDQEVNDISKELCDLANKFLTNSKIFFGIGEGFLDIVYMDFKRSYTSIKLFQYEYGRESDLGTPRPVKYKTFTRNNVVGTIETKVNSDDEAYKILEQVFKNRVALIKALI